MYNKPNNWLESNYGTGMRRGLPRYCPSSKTQLLSWDRVIFGTFGYAASYKGPKKVSTMSLDGGLPTRWTYSEGSNAVAWTPI